MLEFFEKRVIFFVLFYAFINSHEVLIFEDMLPENTPGSCVAANWGQREPKSTRIKGIVFSNSWLLFSGCYRAKQYTKLILQNAASILCARIYQTHLKVKKFLGFWVVVLIEWSWYKLMASYWVEITTCSSKASDPAYPSTQAQCGSDQEVANE